MSGLGGFSPPGRFYLCYTFAMAKHIVAPATAEEIAQTLGVTREDREIVERILRELGEYDTDIERREPPDIGDAGDFPPPKVRSPKKGV